MLKYKIVRIVDVRDWDNIVEKTYNRPYCFQQQDGYQSRGIFKISIPKDCESNLDHEMNLTIPEEVNGKMMGVKFKTWLEKDPNSDGFNDKLSTQLFWHRNFYPDIYTLAKDLYEKGLIEPGDYIININW